MLNTSSTTAMANTEQENEVISHRFHMEIFQEGKLALADEILTPDFVLHNNVLPSEFAKGPESIKRFASGVIDCLPDRQFTHHETISKGDKVLIRWTVTGTPKRDFIGVPVSDKPITVTGFDLFRISEGKLAEMWQRWNIGSWQ